MLQHHSRSNLVSKGFLNDSTLSNRRSNIKYSSSRLISQKKYKVFDLAGDDVDWNTSDRTFEFKALSNPSHNHIETFYNYKIVSIF